MNANSRPARPQHRPCPRRRAHTRPLEDTLAWEESRPYPGSNGAGLNDNDEHQLLDILVEDTQ